jgi:non-heme chloroperoxidase
VTRYLARHGGSRVTKAALINGVPPLMVKTVANPLGLPKEVFDGLPAQLAVNRSQFYRDLPSGPFYGYKNGTFISYKGFPHGMPLRRGYD